MFDLSKMQDCCQTCLFRKKCNRHSICEFDWHIVGCLDNPCDKYKRYNEFQDNRKHK